MIIEKINNLTRSRIKTNPCHSNRASSIGDDCERKLVYWRTRWSEAQPIDESLQLIFEEGRTHEAAVLRLLAEAGIEVLEQQTMIEIPELKLTGHMDGVIVEKDEDGRPISVPLEIKSMSEHIWRTVARNGMGLYVWSEVKEAFRARPWLRGYLAQLMVYMKAKDANHAVFVFKNKSTGELAEVYVPFSAGNWDAIAARCRRINKHVEEGTLPDRIPYDPQVCGRCAFNHLCCPDIVNSDPTQFIDDAVLASICSSRDKAEQAYRTFKDMDDRIKDWAKKQEFTTHVVDGTWEISKSVGKRSTRVEIKKIA